METVFFTWENTGKERIGTVEMGKGGGVQNE
jgi:hypothetical protein